MFYALAFFSPYKTHVLLIKFISSYSAKCDAFSRSRELLRTYMSQSSFPWWLGFELATEEICMGFGNQNGLCSEGHLCSEVEGGTEAEVLVDSILSLLHPAPQLLPHCWPADHTIPGAHRRHQVPTNDSTWPSRSLLYLMQSCWQSWGVTNLPRASSLPGSFLAARCA